MTEAELIQTAQATWDNVISLIAIFISMLSGYLIVAYLAGASMTRSQVVIVNTLYSLMTIFILWCVYTLVMRGNEMASIAIEMSTQRVLAPKGELGLAIAGLCGFCSIASLKFMWDVRHPEVK
jgi:ABC-type tungstate transport system substrate-binding protein